MGALANIHVHFGNSVFKGGGSTLSGRQDAVFYQIGMFLKYKGDNV